MPALKFPIKLDKNQHPIIKDANFNGANLVTKDKPIGEMHNSANVAIKNAVISQIGETNLY